MHRILSRLIEDESGQNLIEYGLIAGLIGLGAIVCLKGLATQVGVVFAAVGRTLTSAF